MERPEAASVASVPMPSWRSQRADRETVPGASGSASSRDTMMLHPHQPGPELSPGQQLPSTEKTHVHVPTPTHIRAHAHAHPHVCTCHLCASSLTSAKPSPTFTFTHLPSSPSALRLWRRVQPGFHWYSVIACVAEDIPEHNPKPPLITRLLNNVCGADPSSSANQASPHSQLHMWNPQ